MKRIFEFFGGRKNFNSYLALVCVSVAGLLAGASFVEYASFVTGILGIGVFSVAYEDRGKH